MAAGSLACFLAGAIAVATSAGAGTVQMLDGSMHHGAITLDGGILVRGTPSVKVALHNVLYVRLSDDAPDSKYPAGLVLTNGSRIAGNFTSVVESTVQVEGKGMRFPSRDVAWAVYQPFDARIAADIPRGKIGALLPGGDFYEGAVKAADGKSAKVLNQIFGPRIFTAAGRDVHAVVLRGVLPPPAAFEVIMRDGSRYLALDVQARDSGTLTLRHPHYDGLRLNAADVVEVRAAPSRAFVPSEWKPARATEGFATALPDGAPLRSGSQEVLGCTMPGGGSATWRKTLRGGMFFARVAVSSENATGGKTVFVVEADGRPLFRSEPLSAGSTPQIIRCTLPATESLTLKVEGDPRVTALWADAIVLLR